ncbi:hypothetical protein [Streptomyces carpaticus]|uniref:Uncharacterized protein n=1 Tax=Streptomyces carpaticus TaxID=285558 RepID=A0ABV4ZHT0_9ACTN
MSEMRHRAIFESDELFATARQFGQVRKELTRMKARNELPDLPAASRQLADLSRLCKKLTDEVLVRVDVTEEVDLSPVVHAYAAAARSAGRAIQNYSAAYAELGLLHRTSEWPPPDDQHDRRDAIITVRERLENVRSDLGQVNDALCKPAGDMYRSAIRSTAALSRSAHSAPSAGRPLSEDTSPSVTRTAPTPEHRHGR